MSILPTGRTNDCCGKPWNNGKGICKTLRKAKGGDQTKNQLGSRERMRHLRIIQATLVALEIAMEESHLVETRETIAAARQALHELLKDALLEALVDKMKGNS